MEQKTKIRRFTEPEIIKIKELIRDTDLTNSQIAKKFGCWPNSIAGIRDEKTHRRIKVSGFKANTKNKFRVNLNDCLKEIVEMRDLKGYTFKQIANKYNYSISTIRTYYKKGLELQCLVT